MSVIPWNKALLTFVKTGQLQNIGVGSTVERLLEVINYKEEDDDGKSYPTHHYDELIDYGIRFVFKDNIITIVDIRFDDRKPEPNKIYGIDWYVYASKLNLTSFRRMLQTEQIPYWMAVYEIEDEIDDMAIQTKGVPTVSIRFFESGLVSHIAYFANGIHHYDPKYPRLIDPEDVE